MARELLLLRGMSEAQDSIHNPHDRLFKAVFGRPENAAALIASLLPGRVLRDLDMSTLRPEPTSSIDARLREHFSDLVFSIRHRHDDQRLYVVLEHKSTPDLFTAHAVDRYSVGITDRQLKTQRRLPGLPITVCIVIYHGPNKWNAPRSLHELYHGSANLRRGLREYAHGSKFLLYDVVQDGDRALRRRRMPPLATLTLWLLAHARTSTELATELATELDRVIDLFRLVFDERGGSEDVVMLVRYILDVTDASLEDLDNYFNRAFGHRAQEVSMLTTGERLRQEGRQSQLLMLLRHRFGELPHEVIERVNSADIQTLDAWALHLLDANTLDQVFASHP